MNKFDSALRHLQHELKYALFLAAATPLLRRGEMLAICLALSIGISAGSAAPAQSSGQSSGGSGSQQPGTQGNTAPNRARQLAALKKACDTGALSKEECNQRMAAFNAQSGPQYKSQRMSQITAAQRGTPSDPNYKPADPSFANDPSYNPNAPNSNPNDSNFNPNPPKSNPNDSNYNPNPSNSNFTPSSPLRSGVFRESQGRYSLTVPDGWTATPMNDGSGTLKLSNGPVSATVTLMTWAGNKAAKPKDIAYAVLDDLAKQYPNGGIGDQGGFKNNGHAAFRVQASGDDTGGGRVAALAVSVQISGKDFITVLMTAPMAQADAAADQVRQMVQSIHFAGE